MTDPGEDIVRTIVGRGATALVLGTAHHRHRRDRSPARRTVLAVATAFAAPAALTGRILADPRTRWQPPMTVAGRAVLVTYVVVGALVEELVWRAPLLHLSPGRRRRRAAALSAGAFAAIHLRHDGPRSAAVHLPVTAGWTLATLLGGRVTPALAAHTAYNLVALSTRPAACAPDGA